MAELSYPDQREQLLEVISKLFNSNVMSRSGHANLSTRLSDGNVLLSQEGFVKNLAPQDFAVLSPNGEVLEGTLGTENIEIIRMHVDLYQTRSDVGSIIHTHSPHLLAFALANKELPVRYEGMLRMGQSERVPVVPWAPRGTEESVGGIVDAVKKHPGTNAVLLANHGVLVFSSSPSAAATLLMILEEAAEAELSALAVGGALDLPLAAVIQVEAAIAKATR